MKKTKLTTKALSMLLTVIMLFTTISVGIIVPETRLDANAAEVGETISVTTVAQLNSAIASANTAGVNKITTIKLGTNISYSGSLSAFTTLSSANVVFDFNGNSLTMNYEVSGEYESSQTGVQLPSENSGKYYNGTDTLTKGMFNISSGSTMQIINTKPGNICTMQAKTEFRDTKKNKDLSHQTSSTLIYCEGTLILGSLNTSYNDFTLYAHSRCAATNGDNPNLYGKKSATSNVNTVVINNNNAIFKMYGGKVNATGSARARRGTYADILCYALNVNSCYSAEIYGGEINIPKDPNEQNNGIFQSTSKACEGGTARISAIRCASPYLYIFNVTSSVQSKTGSDSSNSNTQYTSNIYTTDTANAPYVYGGKFDYYVEKGNNSSTASNKGYIVRGAYKLASNGTLTPSAVSGTDYNEQSADQGDSKTGSLATYTVFISDNGVQKNASNEIVKTDMAAENGIDMFSYSTYRHYLAQYSAALDVYHGNSIMTTNGNATGEVGSTNYLLNGYTHDNWAGKTHPGAAYSLSNTTPSAAGVTNGGSLYLAPAWTENVYNIVYDYDDAEGNPVNDTSTCFTTYKITDDRVLGTPGRNGYKFLGWTITKYEYPATDTKKPWSLGEYPAGFSIKGRNGHLWLKARWEVIDYTATFKPGGGTISSSTADVVKSYNVNKIFQFPAASTVKRDYYDFTGYFKVTKPGGSWQEDGTLYAAGSYTDTGAYGNVEFTAQFTPKNYTVSYNSDGGTSVDNGTYSIESTTTLPAVTRQGYHLIGWQPTMSVGNWDSGTVYPAGTSFKGMHGDVDLKAKWETAKFDLTFSYESGPVTVVYSYKDALTIDNPTKNGYIFGGWKVVAAPDSNTTWVIGDVHNVGIASGKVTIPANQLGAATFEPIWTADTYTITFISNGGAGVDSITYKITDSFTLPATTKKGYVLAGWDMTENVNGNWTKSTYALNEALSGMYGNVTLTARWDKENYAITLDSDGGTAFSPLNYDFESIVPLPVPSKTGYDFIGWKVTSADASSSWELGKEYTAELPQGENGNATLTAQWKPSEYNIHFTSSGTTPSDLKYHINDDAFRVPASSYPGYSFLYWKVAADAGNWVKDEKIYTYTDISGKYGNVNLVAEFECITYTIIYRDIDGTETVVEYDMTQAVQIPTYERAGYTFSGWSLQSLENGSGWPSVCQPGSFEVGGCYGNAVLTPILKETEYELTFIPDGGTAYPNLSYTIISDATLPVPEKTGYDFAGWKVSVAGGSWTEGEIVSGDSAVKNRYGNATLTAQWTSKKYNITWITGSGTFTTEGIYDAMPDYTGVNTDKAPDAQYTYTFTGWSPALAKVNGEATYEAQYSKSVNSYTVTWRYETDETSGMNTAEAVYNYGEHPIFNNGTNPVKTSISGKYYRFVGWVDADGNYLNDATVVTGDITYTAVYKEIEAPRTVTWVIDGVSQATQWEVGETPAYVGTPVKADSNGIKYTFSHWTPAVGVVEANKDYTYTAVFTESAQKYTATFDLNGGTYSGLTEVIYDKVNGLDMPQPEKEGYSFVGWRVTVNGGTWTDTGLLKFTTYTGLWGNVSFTAEYTAAEYTIKVESDAGTVTEYKYTIESTDTLPLLTKDGYTLSGWVVVAAEGNWLIGDTVAPDKALQGMFGNITIHPVWNARLYKINWVSGDITQTVEFRFGEAVVAYPPISKPGYTVQWDSQVPAVMPAEDLTFNAVYTPIQYYLRFNAAGGTTVENFYYDITSDGTLPSATREGATFKGWKVSAGTGSWIKNKVYEAGTSLNGMYGNITLTAVWEIQLHTVTWVAGDVTRVTKWYHGATPSYDGVPYKSSDEYNSYVFKGWDKPIVTVTEDVTYTALFDATERLYTVRWSVDGFIAEETKYSYGDVPVYGGLTPVRESTTEFDFTFAGWTPEINSVTGDITYVAMFDVFTKLLGLRVDKTAVFLKIGEEAVVSAIISPSTASAKDVVWTSLNEQIATVNAMGKITATGAGEAVIRVQSKDGKFNSYCVVSVAPVITEYIVISANGVSTTRLPGEAIQLTATVQPGNATNKNIVWSSSNTAVAVVDNNGLVVFGETQGTAVITAVADGYAVGTIEVCTTTKESEIEDTVKTYMVMFVASSSSYVIEGYTFESLNVIYPEGSTVEFLLTEPHFVTLNGVQHQRDTDGVFRITNLSQNYTVVATERADLGLSGGEEEENPSAPKLTFFDKLKAFFRSIVEFFRNLF